MPNFGSRVDDATKLPNLFRQFETDRLQLQLREITIQGFEVEMVYILKYPVEERDGNEDIGDAFSSEESKSTPSLCSF